MAPARNFIFGVQIHLTISKSSLSIKVIGLRSKSNFTMKYFTSPFKTYLKSQGHLNVTEYQDKFSVFCEYFCDLCVTWMVCL